MTVSYCKDPPLLCWKLSGLMFHCAPWSHGSKGLSSPRVVSLWAHLKQDGKCSVCLIQTIFHFSSIVPTPDFVPQTLGGLAIWKEGIPTKWHRKANTWVLPAATDICFPWSPWHWAFWALSPLDTTRLAGSVKTAFSASCIRFVACVQQNSSLLLTSAFATRKQT